MLRLFAAVLLAAVGALPAAAQTRWVMATAYPDANYHTRNIRQFIQEVEQATEGRLQIQLHASASLLPMPQIKRAVQTGQIQLGEILMSVHGNEDAFFEVDGVPFLAETWEASAALMRASEPFIRARLQRQGVELLYMANWASQGFYTREPVTTLEQLRGARFRAYNAITIRMAELMGATPVTVQSAELAQAFATNVVTVMFTSAQTGVDTASWDYAKVFTDVGGMRARNGVLANARAMATLDEPTRQAVRAAAARAAERAVGIAQEAERSTAARLRERGMQVTGPTPELLAQLREVGAKQIQDWLAKAGPDGQVMMERYRAALAR
ncbi:C4-dicarboxylate ABC transporter substrate-binding protein [Siccirubricoccus deserti]|uniref:TRAP transporter substrate-binding protein n=1 Tax=Siccirubricoccus deserti TaxID=2013562 RepID=A0A9X0QYE9_9PROT|nr:TRAP transporter substrate-binding protein [Siccirubricoccus deserti]MBC4015870.1 TRAP transporter substrate-binding protein [Siccirubricoccus deserti]GGC45264.1 C4-dicarboxylate ABC transporter substrate-binding protein [Siccirubricoccus deserti]